MTAARTPAKRAPGRPAEAGEARVRVVRLRCTDTEAERWEAAADAEGTPWSEWAREVMDAAARRAR